MDLAPFSSVSVACSDLAAPSRLLTATSGALLGHAALSGGLLAAGASLTADTHGGGGTKHLSHEKAFQ